MKAVHASNIAHVHVCLHARAALASRALSLPVTELAADEAAVLLGAVLLLVPDLLAVAASDSNWAL